MTNAEILLELDEIMSQVSTFTGMTSILDRLAAIRSAIARRPAEPAQ